MNKDQAGLRIESCGGGNRTQIILPAGILAGVMVLLGLSLLIPHWFPTVGSSWWWLFLGCFGLALVLVFLHTSRAGRWALPVGAVLLVLFCLVFRQAVTAGLGALAGDLTDSLSVKTSRIYLEYTMANKHTTLWAAAPLLALAVLLLTQSIASGRLLFALPVLLPVYLGVLTGLFPPDGGFVLIAAGSVILLTHCAHCHRGGGGLFSGLTFTGITAVCLAVALGAALLTAPILPENGAQLLSTALHRLRHHSQTVSMPEGNLENLGQWEKSETPALELTMENPAKIYLRGMVYDTYTGTGWACADPNQLAQQEGLFYWLHQSGFYGQSQIGFASRLTAQLTPQTITIRTLAACTGHGYLPYAIYDSNAMAPLALGDTTMAKTETVLCLPGSVPEWYLVQKNLASSQNRTNVQSYLSAEQAYEAYVTATDIQLTNDSWAVLQRQLEGDNSPKTLSQIRQIIRDYLEENLVYDETIHTANGNSDFLQYTLEHSGSGYSVHYATAATLMLRYFGVPARYVEGYFLSAQEAQRYASGETITLTEAHAHAWAEYYLPGVGFVPFEVTPGYLDDEELLLGGSDTLLEQTYQADNLRYAQVQQPEQIREPVQSRISFSMKPWYLLLLLAAMVLGLSAVIVCRRLRFRKALAAIGGANDREAITMQYGYLRLLLAHCPAKPPEGYHQVTALNQEAFFSQHPMTQTQRQQMEAYTAEVLGLCKTNWSWWQKLRYRLWDCLY